MLDVYVTFNVIENCFKNLALSGRDSMPGSINYRQFLLLFTVASSIFLIGCSGDQEPTYVDFSDRMVVDRSGDESRDQAYLKVAVGSIRAVAMSLVDGTAVNGQVWEYYNHSDPVFTAKTRIIKKSQPFGNPPVVASAHLSNQMKARIQSLLFRMHQDSKGKKILDELMIDGFIAPKEECYEPILAMKKNM